MINIQNIDGYGIQDPGFALLREVAHRYCPEEAVEARQSVFPDEALNLTELEAGFKQLLGGGSGYADLPYFGGERNRIRHGVCGGGLVHARVRQLRRTGQDLRDALA